jgi:3-isopropylmalate/(R)-2-methylmalate dehydratase large subunit
MARPERIRFTGRILFLTEDPALLERQLAGEDLAWDPQRKLIDNISTDEITPGWVCFYYDETLGEYSLVGLRGGAFKHKTLKDGGFDVIVSGKSKGCGSSRETAPYSELTAGVKLVIAESIEKIYGQNAQNIGLLTSTDFGLIPRILSGESIPIEEFTRGLDPISADIVKAGGLFEYNRLRMAGEITAPVPARSARPMTMVEKIIAAHAVVDAKEGKLGVPAVAPDDALFVRTDVRFSHEYVTPMADSLFRQGFGDTPITDPASVYTFRDHLTYLRQVMPEEKRKMGLLERAEGLATTQERFAHKHGLKLYGEVPAGGSEAICHNAVVEDLALPGQIVTGTDSHTCMAGALGCFAFGVGSTDMANAWFTKDVRVRVPETVRFVMKGELASGVAAKDVMLYLLSQPFFRTSKGIGRVLEFAGDGVAKMPLDEQATLTNMAVEAGGFTGIIEPNDAVIAFLHRMRDIPESDLRARIVRSDPGAQYAETFEIDLAKVPVMIATPGDPRNGIPLSDLNEDVRIDIAYGGSCTGGKKADMDMYASVFQQALARGLRVKDGVRCYIQFGSQHIRRYAEERGYVEVFQKAGVELINPSCGACINAGPGASETKEQVSVSAINRNFPGRSGPGKVYLASPFTVAASAIAGRIAGQREMAA